LNELAAVSLNPLGFTKNSSKEPTVPDITPVSYPNKSPPSVAIRVSLNKYLEFDDAPIILNFRYIG
jgi:hypothetical protein